MSPDKKAESPGALEDRVGLRGGCGTGTLPEAECASSPLATSLDRAPSTDDEELTNPQLAPREPSAELHARWARGPDQHRPALRHRGRPASPCPVKDIYGWILEHFPYFSSAPTGWKNSVRHNLSLNKCFRKVEKSLGKVNGKGSLWCVDPEYRPNLIQALKKQHFPAPHGFCTPPASPPSAFSPSRNLFLQGCSLKESDIDAATAMMLLNSAPGHHAGPCDPDGPMDLSRPDSVLVSSDPKQDHNYSSSSFQRCSSRSSSSSSSSSSPSLSSLEEGGGGGDSAQVRRAGSEGFHSDEDSEEERGPRRPTPSPRRPTAPPCKRARCEARPELDEELKEAAGSLLHLAGIRSCLDLSKRAAATAKSKKTEKLRK
ncbi:hypothetical protein AOLI_G00027550 [Acnodon oligacanthus]